MSNGSKKNVNCSCLLSCDTEMFFDNFYKKVFSSYFEWFRDIHQGIANMNQFCFYGNLMIESLYLVQFDCMTLCMRSTKVDYCSFQKKAVQMLRIIRHVFIITNVTWRGRLKEQLQPLTENFNYLKKILKINPLVHRPLLTPLRK